MKFYYSPGSAYARRVEALIEHLGLDVEKVELDFTKGEFKSPEYMAINPNGKVPSLVDGDFVLWESTAIMHYLATKQETSLFPNDARVRADILRWQSWELTSLGRATGTLNFELLFKKMFMSAEPDAAKVEEAYKDFHRFAPILEAQLVGKKYVLGDDLTLADFSIGAAFMYAALAEFDWAGYPEIQRWYGGLCELPAWQSSGPKM